MSKKALSLATETNYPSQKDSSVVTNPTPWPKNALNLTEKLHFGREKLGRNLFGHATYDYGYNYTILKI